MAGKKKKEPKPYLGIWKRKSMFWDLPYWHILGMPHSLDLMHIIKNVCKSLLGTLLNMPQKTKDGPKARHGLVDLEIRADLHVPPWPGSAVDQPKEADGRKHKRECYCPLTASLLVRTRSDNCSSAF
jgi:hypothetical protein